MRSRVGILFVPGLLAWALCAPALRAQDLTIFAGGLFPGNANVDGGSVPLDDGPILGIRFATGFAAVLKLEHSFAFSGDLLFPHGRPDVTSAKGFLFHSNLLVDIPLGVAVPYLTAGLGFIHQYGSNNLPVGTKFAINYGGGLKFTRVFGPAGFRIDARGFTATGVVSHSLNMLELSGGFLFSF